MIVARFNQYQSSLRAGKADDVGLQPKLHTAPHLAKRSSSSVSPFFYIIVVASILRKSSLVMYCLYTTNHFLFNDHLLALLSLFQQWNSLSSLCLPLLGSSSSLPSSPSAMLFHGLVLSQRLLTSRRNLILEKQAHHSWVW